MALAQPRDQLALDEQQVEDDALESALEERLRLKIIARETRKSYAEADEAAQAAIGRWELPDGGVLRCGRFRIERQYRPGRAVSFETEAKSRLRISVVDEE